MHELIITIYIQPEISINLFQLVKIPKIFYYKYLHNISWYIIIFEKDQLAHFYTPSLESRWLDKSRIEAVIDDINRCWYILDVICEQDALISLLKGKK
jgi:hypothetical protein